MSLARTKSQLNTNLVTLSMYRNLLYYKYVPIKAPELFKEKHKQQCVELGLKGKILVSHEGINGCVSGTFEATEAYMKLMHEDERFHDMQFKIGETEGHTFTKMLVKTRPEIVTFGTDVSLENSAPYIEPEELKSLLDAGEDIVLIDARNKYEADYGTFENAIVPDIQVFSKFPEEAKKWEDLKDKQIVTFCTGGIRCEKASAFLRENGFENVRQLHGGILTYAEKVGGDHWDGKCFVFDERVAVGMDCGCGFEPNKEDSSGDDPVAFKKALGY